MAVFKCSACGHVVETRCKPGKCPNCGAPKDQLVKQQ
ncbi:MAG: RCKP-type rubredoxin-like domain-containing protein [Chitinophagales bacterium]